MTPEETNALRADTLRFLEQFGADGATAKTIAGQLGPYYPDTSPQAVDDMLGFMVSAQLTSSRPSALDAKVRRYAITDRGIAALRELGF